MRVSNPFQSKDVNQQYLSALQVGAENLLLDAENLIQQYLPTKVWWVNQIQQHPVLVNDPESSASSLGNLLCVLSGRRKVVIGAVVLPVVVLICVFQVNGSHVPNRSEKLLGELFWQMAVIPFRFPAPSNQQSP